MKSKILTIFLSLAALIGINLLASQFFFRWDLTEEKRYSLSDATVNLLENLDDEVYVKVYLTGELNPDFKRLENAVRETLDEFKVHANTHINFRFIDPTTEKNKEKREQSFVELAKKGIQPTNIFDNENGKKTEKLVFPGAILSYKDTEITVPLLKGNKAQTAQEQLNQSCENTEFQLATAIKQLTITNKKRIGFFPTYSSVPAQRQQGIWTALYKNYEVYPIDLAQSPTLDSLDAIAILKPDRPFSDADKFKIDQFIMHGGKAIFMLDATRLDSVGRGEGNYLYPNLTGLEDLLFKYGVRLNPDVIKDMECALIPMRVGMTGNQPQIQPVEWTYFPLLNRYGNSPIVRNLDVVLSRFVGTIDTVKATGIIKTPLIFTSQYTQVKAVPTLVSYNEARQAPDPKTYQAGTKAVAYLLEGEFESFYKNQILPEDPRFARFKAKGEPNKIVVIADADIALNDVDAQTQKNLPIGFDRLSQHTFGNKDLITNAIDYLLDENGIIAARNKQITLRPLDKIALQEDRTKWQSINLVLPLLILVAFGFVRNWWRKRRFAGLGMN